MSSGPLFLRRIRERSHTNEQRDDDWVESHRASESADEF
jgi:hypothetical protein